MEASGATSCVPERDEDDEDDEDEDEEDDPLCVSARAAAGRLDEAAADAEADEVSRKLASLPDGMTRAN